MRRRLHGLVLPALTAVALVLPASAAVAAGSGDLILATEAGTGTAVGEAPAPGPEPLGPDVSENPAAPEEYEPPFLWAVSWLLGIPILLGLLAMGGLYYLLVWRPRQLGETPRK